MTISVTRALSELKLLDKKIEKAINACDTVCGAAQVNKIPTGYDSREDYLKQSKATLQSVNDLIVRRQCIKNAIVLSNAATKVSIGNVEMTVAEAIEQKVSVVYKKNFLNKLKLKRSRDLDLVSAINVRAEEQFNKQAETILGKDSQNNSEYAALHNSFMAINAHDLLEPKELPVLIDKLEKEIDNFESEVDFVLSESNTITQLEV